jgi:DNA end-binding protein Ku
MAASLIDTMTEDFDPTLYKDTYREALEALVQAKIEGNEVVRPAGTVAPANEGSGPADLTETLRASVAAAKANRKDAGDGKDAKEEAPARSRQRKPAASRRKASA